MQYWCKKKELGQEEDCLNIIVQSLGCYEEVAVDASQINTIMTGELPTVENLVVYQESTELA